jgi:anti-anti-sigma factor
MYDMIKVIEKREDGVFVVKLVIEEIHLSDVMQLNNQLQDLIQGGNVLRMVIDLSGVHLMTSAAIGMLLNINRIIKSNLKLSSPSMGVQKCFEFTNLPSVIPVFNTVEEALSSNI